MGMGELALVAYDVQGAILVPSATGWSDRNCELRQEIRSQVDNMNRRSCREPLEKRRSPCTDEGSKTDSSVLTA